MKGKRSCGYRVAMAAKRLTPEEEGDQIEITKSNMINDIENFNRKCLFRVIDID
jgi:hypothetical protein